MTYEELVDAQAIPEIDDVHAANAILNETVSLRKELRMFRIARLLAVLREHYVQVGRDLEKLER